MSDTFTSSQVDENAQTHVAGMDFHHGPMDFSVQYSVPNKVDSMLDFNTEYTSSIAIARRGKHPIVAKSITTVDIPHSDVAKDWEDRNDKAKTEGRKRVALTTAIAAGFDLLGKVVADLQKDTAINTSKIFGTLKYVTDYTGFSGDPELQEGNYLAIKAVNNVGATKMTVQFAGRSEIVLDPDLTHVQRFPSAIPYVTVRAYDANDKVIDAQTYDLSALVLEPAENS